MQEDEYVQILPVNKLHTSMKLRSYGLAWNMHTYWV